MGMTGDVRRHHVAYHERWPCIYNDIRHRSKTKFSIKSGADIHARCRGLPGEEGKWSSLCQLQHHICIETLNGVGAGEGSTS